MLLLYSRYLRCIWSTYVQTMSVFYRFSYRGTSLRFNVYCTVPILKGRQPSARVVLEKGKRTLTRGWRGRSWAGWWRSQPWRGSRRRAPPWSTSRSTNPRWLLSRRNRLRNIHFHIRYGVRCFLSLIHFLNPSQGGVWGLKVLITTLLLRLMF